jgi:hypothetical protein
MTVGRTADRCALSKNISTKGPRRTADPSDLSWKRCFYPQTELSSRLPRRAVGPERSVVERSAVLSTYPAPQGGSLKGAAQGGAPTL